jgi:uncharacterized protein YcfL
MKLSFRGVLAIALVSSLAVVGPVSAQIIKGTAEIGITQPVTKVVDKTVVTTMKIKNLSKGPIAGLKVEEYWYDKAGNPSPGGSRVLNQPLAPGAVVSIELKTPRTPDMDRNTYQFSHANGKVNARVMAKIE